MQHLKQFLLTDYNNPILSKHILARKLSPGGEKFEVFGIRRVGEKVQSNLPEDDWLTYCDVLDGNI